MSRCVFGSQRSLDETGKPLGPMTVRTVAEVAVTSCTDSERRSWIEDDDDEELSEAAPGAAADDDDEEEDEKELECVLLVEQELAMEDARERSMRWVNDGGLLEMVLVCCSNDVEEDASPLRRESVLATVVLDVEADATCDASEGPADDDGNNDTSRTLATMTLSSAITS